MSYIQMKDTKTTRLLFKGSWILLYSLHSNWQNFGYISGKVGKPHILESPLKSLKTRQNPYQKGHPLRNNDRLKHEKCVFYWRFFFQTKNCWHFEFLMNQIFRQRFIILEKLRYRGLLLLKLRVVEVATLFHFIFLINLITSTRK